MGGVLPWLARPANLPNMPGERPTPPEARSFKPNAPEIESPELGAIVERERAKLKEFWGKDLEPGPLPKEITAEHVREWREMGFELHWLPKEKYDPKETVPGWKFPPPADVPEARGSMRGYYETTGEPSQYYPWKDVHDPQGRKFEELPGEWQLWDELPQPSFASGPNLSKEEKETRPAGRAQMDRAVEQVLHTFSDQQVLFDEVHDKKVLGAIAKNLGVPREQVRFPRFIERNYIGNAFHPAWGDFGQHAEFLEETYGEPQLDEYWEQQATKEKRLSKKYRDLSPVDYAKKKWGAYVPNDNESKWKKDGGGLLWHVQRLWAPSGRLGDERLGFLPFNGLSSFYTIPERHGAPINMGFRVVISVGEKKKP